ncbi:MAG: magnesium/cobalt transporter CorA [Flavobacteriaceae bacterium]|nr:magnesium/cobalt transporter CorA [Flavobacteriaceae bacterium]
MLDTVVDQYFLTLENFSEKIEELEFALLENPNKETLNAVYELRRESLSLRRCVYPMREMINRLEKLEEPIINKETKIYVRDLYDHTIQIIETVEVFREMVIGLLELYMNSVSNKLNEIMKVLTIMSSIFIPLTFVVGVYGMNFDNMPILHYKYGYYAVWAVMALIVCGYGDLF